MQSHEISKGHHYRVSLQIMFNDIQPHLARKEMKFCGNKMGTDKAKRKRLSVDIQLLSRFTRTQTRGRTGMEVNPLVFETSASTDSAIWALVSNAVQRYGFFLNLQEFYKKKEKKRIKDRINTSIFRE